MMEKVCARQELFYDKIVILGDGGSGSFSVCSEVSEYAEA